MPEHTMSDMLTCTKLCCVAQSPPLDISLPAGEHMLVLGPSGSGKTTLLFTLAGLLKPASGSVTYGSNDLYRLSTTERDRFRGNQLGIIFQTLHLVKALNVRQNMQLAMSMAGKAADDTRIDDILKRLGLAEKATQKADRLSVGEAQRLAVGRAVVGKPHWLLCDEPTSALDDANTNAMLNLLESEAAACGASLIIVTHDKRVKDRFKDRQIIRLGEEVRA